MKKWRCTVCGYIHKGDEPPDKCPVCGADKSLFEEVVETAEETADAAAAETPDPPPETPPEEPAKSDPENPPVGRFGEPYQLLIGQMLKHHAHPISTHIPNGVLPITFLFLLLAMVTGSKSLDTAAFCNLIMVVLTIPVVIFSGFVEWRHRYKGIMTGQFKLKIACAAVVAAGTLILVLWRIASPDVLTATSTGRNLFVFIGLITVTAAGIAGFIGGKLVFKD
ncbi:MAG: hypothetical protein LJE94_06375 [Deltaproteobacteria bacterium]|nr:hypothetical protein [Deltaproteobacteria bacterium]